MLLFASLISGSSGNCIVLSHNGTNILIDCGMSAKKAGEALSKISINPNDISAILVTHEHIDHISGVGVMSRKHNIPVYANEKTWLAMEQKLGNITDANRRVFENYDTFEIGNIGIKPFKTPHDSADSVGYSMFAGNKKVSLATDIGCVTREMLDAVRQSDMVILEANHDVEMLKTGPYSYSLKQRILSDSGHLSNDMSARFAYELVKNGTKKIMLGHLSNENNLPQLAFETVKSFLQLKDVKINADVQLSVAKRFDVSCLCGENV